MTADMTEEQEDTCRRFGVAHMPVIPTSKLGVARNVRTGILPLNGLRHPPDGDSCGWYIWAGEELSDAHDFFQPLHVWHVPEWCPTVLKYLALPPGWRFLIAGEYEDVWFDETLLDV